LGMPVSPLCDRECGRFAGPQVGFIDFIVRPTFDLLAALAHRVENEVLPELSANLVVWEERKAEEELAAQSASAEADGDAGGEHPAQAVGV